MIDALSFSLLIIIFSRNMCKLMIAFFVYSLRFVISAYYLPKSQNKLKIIHYHIWNRQDIYTKHLKNPR